MMQQNTKKRMSLAIMVLFLFMVGGLFIGGTSFSFDVMKRYFAGAGIGIAIYFVLAIIKRTPAGKNTFIKSMPG